MSFCRSDFILYIVDNGSTPQDSLSLERFLVDCFKYDLCIVKNSDLVTSKRCYFFKNSLNIGYAAGNNVALNYIENCLPTLVDYILILNNDIEFTEDVLTGLINFASHNRHFGILSPLLLKSDGYSIDLNCARRQLNLKNNILIYLLNDFNFLGLRDYINAKSYVFKTENSYLDGALHHEVDLTSGSCMLLNREYFAKLGFFDENTFLYYEENILCEKFKLLGLKNYVLTNVRCIHHGGESTKLAPSLFIAKCSVSSNYYFVKEYLKPSPIYCLFLKFLHNLVLFRVRFFTLVNR